jgi:hypothetical protein
MLSRNLPRETDENHENLSQGSRPPGRDLNPGPCEYEEGVDHSITMLCDLIKESAAYIRTRDGPRHVGAPGRLIIWPQSTRCSLNICSTFI